MVSQNYAIDNLINALDLIGEVEFDNDYYKVTTFKDIIKTVIDNMTISEYKTYKNKEDRYGRTKYCIKFPMYDFVKDCLEFNEKEEKEETPNYFVPNMDLQPPFIPLVIDAEDLDSTKGVYIP